MSTIRMSHGHLYSAAAAVDLMELAGDGAGAREDRLLGHAASASSSSATAATTANSPFLFPFIISVDDEADIRREMASGGYGDRRRQHQLMQHAVSQQEVQFDERMLSVEAGPSFLSMHRAPSPPPPLPIAAAVLEHPPAPKMKIVKKLVRESSGFDAAVRKPRRRSSSTYASTYDGELQADIDGGVIRVCSDCKTTKTPLWRSGPCGPKSLCNACGIRQRKARRALAASAGSAGHVSAAGDHRTPKPKKEKKPPVAAVDRSLPFKKRCKMTFGSAPAVDAVKRDQEDGVDGTIISGGGAFPQEETDAAMLLMTLSCGLISS